MAASGCYCLSVEFTTLTGRLGVCRFYGADQVAAFELSQRWSAQRPEFVITRRWH